jgi:hypothetical protein
MRQLTEEYVMPELLSPQSFAHFDLNESSSIVILSASEESGCPSREILRIAQDDNQMLATF